MNFDIKEQSVEEALQRVRGVIRSIMSDKKNSRVNNDDILELNEGNLFTDTHSKAESKNKPIDVVQAIDDVILKNEEDDIQEEIKDSIAKIQKMKKPHSEEENLVSEESAQLSQESIRTLRKNLKNSPTENFSSKEDLTVEQLVVASMKPYLKEWLDKNLPQIVKSLVEKEIKKLIPED